MIEHEPTERTSRQRGQTLLVVALSMFALFAFVALAVDVGYWYGERRHMQNAADAGALAGAYQFCYESDKSESAVTSAALDYAESNGATRILSSVQLDADTGTVVVTAVTPAEFFFARVISTVSDFSIGAVAAAQCGAADEGCGMWPIAMDQPMYNDISQTGNCNGPTEWDDGTYISSLTPNSGAGRDAKSQFILWAGDNANYVPSQVERHCFFMSNPGGAGNEYTLADVVGGSPMDPGNRGWVALRLLPGFDIPDESAYTECKSTGNCGASALNCWLQFGYIGQIAVGDCLATEDGGIANSLKRYATLRVGDPVSVILYDHPGTEPACNSSDNPATCNGSKVYHVAGIGCVLVEHVFTGENCDCSNGRTKDYLQWRKYVLGGTNPGDAVYTIRSSRTDYEIAPGVYGTNEYGFGCYKDKSKWVCANNEPLTYACPADGLGIVVTKLCSCPPTYCISSGGGGDSAIDAVSLIPVPGT